MCGIAGLFLKTDRLEGELGNLLTDMLVTLSDRGPDSAGFAVYPPDEPGRARLTLRGGADTDFDAVVAAIRAALGVDIHAVARDTHVTLSVPEGEAERVRAHVEGEFPEIGIVSFGKQIEMFKEVGRPDLVARRFDLAKMRGSHAIGHTRMATESAVTTDGAHPFTTGSDQCLVHNGSLSNHNLVRRRLAREGIRFETENDSEVAAGYLTWRMRQGASLGEALEGALSDLDGFYTFVVGTRNGFGVLRDPIACKPAVMAETGDYVAFGSEFRALAALPGIETAEVWEPAPGKVYFWERTNAGR